MQLKVLDRNKKKLTSLYNFPKLKIQSFLLLIFRSTTIIISVKNFLLIVIHLRSSYSQKEKKKKKQNKMIFPYLYNFT